MATCEQQGGLLETELSHILFRLKVLCRGGLSQDLFVVTSLGIGLLLFW